MKNADPFRNSVGVDFLSKPKFCSRGLLAGPY
jgi:hypothetical protein